jgi:hypothetical protein
VNPTLVAITTWSRIAARHASVVAERANGLDSPSARMIQAGYPTGISMALVDSLLPELKHEMANTRKLVERGPLERGHWKPHLKSRMLLQLASHVADLPFDGRLAASWQAARDPPL